MKTPLEEFGKARLVQGAWTVEPPALTPVRLHKLRRDIAIVALARIGATAVFLSDVFDLDESMIRRILRSGVKPGGKLGCED